MPFVKGQIGNPKGRKPDVFTPVIRDMLETIGQDSSYQEKAIIAQKLIDLAKTGDMAAIRYCMDKVDGTPTQRVEQDVTSAGESLAGIPTERLVEIVELDKMVDDCK
jgi:hypothetical protein